MLKLAWIAGKLGIRRETVKPEKLAQPAQPRQLADFLRRCQTCGKLRALPGQNPGLLLGVCECSWRAERDGLADRVSGLHF